MDMTKFNVIIVEDNEDDLIPFTAFLAGIGPAYGQGKLGHRRAVTRGLAELRVCNQPANQDGLVKHERPPFIQRRL